MPETPFLKKKNCMKQPKRTRFTAQGPKSKNLPSNSKALWRWTWLSNTCNFQHKRQNKLKIDCGGTLFHNSLRLRAATIPPHRTHAALVDVTESLATTTVNRLTRPVRLYDSSRCKSTSNLHLVPRCGLMISACSILITESSTKSTEKWSRTKMTAANISSTPSAIL